MPRMYIYQFPFMLLGDFAVIYIQERVFLPESLVLHSSPNTGDMQEHDGMTTAVVGCLAMAVFPPNEKIPCCLVGEFKNVSLCEHHEEPMRSLTSCMIGFTERLSRILAFQADTRHKTGL